MRLYTETFWSALALAAKLTAAQGRQWVADMTPNAYGAFVVRCIQGEGVDD